jgi:hypothetical protein
MNKKLIIPAIGAVFTVGVIALLVYLHLFASLVVPKTANVVSAKPEVWVCDSIHLSWITESDLTKALSFWKSHGYEFGEVSYHKDCSSIPMCFKDDERTTKIACQSDVILLVLAGQHFDPNHLGETTVYVEGQRQEWGTIELPSQVPPSVVSIAGEDDLLNTVTYPKDIQSLVLAHEIGHWLGYQHTYTTILGPIHSENTGHIMSPKASTIGWDAEGI